MRLGIMTGYSGAKIELPLDIIQEADRLGVYAVWTAEAYGSDCITPLAWMGALTKNIAEGKVRRYCSTKGKPQGSGNGNASDVCKIQEDVQDIEALRLNRNRNLFSREIT